MADTVIRNGLIVDGTGAAPFMGDIAIKDGKILAVAESLPEIRGTREIDATGKVVAPGWVDIHSHLDAQASWDPSLEPLTSNGVTTVVMGNCGVGFAPVRASQRKFLMELMEGVEDIPLGALDAGINWQWETFPEFLNYLGQTHLGCDVAALIGHGAVRAWVLGERANLSDRPGGPKNDPVTPEEMDAMADVVREAVAAGAIGFSTSRTLLHRDKSGVLVPGTLAAEQELLAIARGIRQGGGGVFEMASDFMAHDDAPHTAEDHAERLAHFAREWAWMNRVALQERVPVCFCLGIPSQDGPLGHGFRQMLDDAQRARSAGANITAQVFTRPQGVLMSWESRSHPFVEAPTFQRLRAEAASAGTPLDRAALCSDAALRAQILAETRALAAAAPEAGAWGISLPQSTGDETQEETVGNLNGAVTGRGALARMLLAGARFVFRWDPSYEPKPDESALAEAQRRGGDADALEVLFDWMCEREGTRVVSLVFMNYSCGDLSDTMEMLTHPVTIPGLGDAGAHLGFICDNASHTFLLSYWVRDRSCGPRLKLENAVKMHTLDTARAFGFEDRGALLPGLRADVNVMDMDTLQVLEPELVNDLPRGAQRWVQRTQGYVLTMCNGVISHENNQPTGALPGRLVRNPGTFATRGSDLAVSLGKTDAPPLPSESLSGRIASAIGMAQWEVRAGAIKALTAVLGPQRLEDIGLWMYSKPLAHVSKL